MELFAVYRQAVYRHGCGGIFSNMQAAIDCANSLALDDGDSHHDYEVVPYTLDQSVEVEILDRRWKFCSPTIKEAKPRYITNRDKQLAKGA